MIKQSDRILAEGLVKNGFLTQRAVDKYLAEVETSSEGLKSYLVRHGYATEKQILDSLSAVLNLPTVDLRTAKIDKSVVEKIPVRFAWFYKFMPMKIDQKTLILASSAPLDVKFQDAIRTHLGLEPQVMLAREADIFDAINKHYGLAADMIDRLTKETANTPSLAMDPTRWVEDLEKDTDEVTVSKLVNQILLEAHKRRATDIHIEPYRHKVRIRYRIDGVLMDANIPASVKRFLPSILSRIKILSNLSIVEKRLPQDGSAVVKTKEQDLDLRISTIPTPHGESMVIRILPTNITLLSLEKLGLDQKNLKRFRDLVKKPYGIILVTGPTGSGKTTTLYACLNEINSDDRKIITLEDPIEYEMEGITQIQVNPKVNLSFATGLRSVLRHDPDILMVGEIRDLETAEIAIRTALTGHVVFSTLHTNDAASGITRFIEMGVEPFLVSSSIEAFVAQRLVRVICPQCKVESKSPLLRIREEMAEALQVSGIESVKIFRGRGCDLCHQTGFYGRTAIYEILVIDEDIKVAILEKRRADDIKELAMKKGMMSLRQDGWRKVSAGITTPTEVIDATVKDKSPEGTPRDIKEEKAAPQPVIISPETLSVKNEYDSRIHPRLTKGVGIRYAIVKPDPKDPMRFTTDGIEHSSLTKNISASGLRFVSGYALPVPTILDLKIQLEKSEATIHCLAKVCRVEDDVISAMFNLVAYYLDISSGDRVRITNFVKAQLEE